MLIILHSKVPLFLTVKFLFSCQQLYCLYGASLILVNKPTVDGLCAQYNTDNLTLDGVFDGPFKIFSGTHF